MIKDIIFYLKNEPFVIAFFFVLLISIGLAWMWDKKCRECQELKDEDDLHWKVGGSK